eukprot:12757618-Ditylum_brightwellii.AAC.1
MPTQSVDCAARRTRPSLTLSVGASSWLALDMQSTMTGCVNTYTGATYKITMYLSTPIGRNTSQNQQC